MSKIKPTDKELLTQHIEKLPEDIQPAVDYLRQIISVLKI